jgi:hypothetical protein
MEAKPQYDDICDIHFCINALKVALIFVRK